MCKNNTFSYFSVKMYLSETFTQGNVERKRDYARPEHRATDFQAGESNGSA